MLHSTEPLGDHDLIKTRISEHMALDALSTWQGTQVDVLALRRAINVARALAAVDEVPAISRAAQALVRCRHFRPGSIGMEADDFDAVRDAVAIVEAQRSGCSAKDYARALLRARL